MDTDAGRQFKSKEMEIEMSLPRISVKMIAACLVLIAAPILAAAQTTSIDPINVIRASAPVSIYKGQAVSLNFTNVSDQIQEVKFNFFDMDGNLLKSSVARVLPGQSANFELLQSEIWDRSTSPSKRLQIRGVVVSSDPPGGLTDTDRPSPDNLLANLEVYDVATGKTSFGLLLPAVRPTLVLIHFV